MNNYPIADRPEVLSILTNWYLIGRMGWHTLGEVEFLNAERGSIYVRDL
jgi:hypothetical protein